MVMKYWLSILLLRAASASYSSKFEALVKTTIKQQVLDEEPSTADSASEYLQSGLDMLLSAEKVANCVLAGVGLNYSANISGYDLLKFDSDDFDFSNISNVSSEIVSKVSEYVDGFSMCDFIDDVVVHWENGCDHLFEQFVSVLEHIPCIVALHCREGGAGRPVDVIHGACLSQCENTPDGTECQSTAIAKGLQHPRICGDDIPPSMLLSYQGFAEIITTLWMLIGTFSWDLVLQRLEGFHGIKGELLPPGIDIVSSWIHCFIIVLIVHIAFGVLGSAGDGCRFITLTSPLLYGPYLYSGGQVLTNVVRFVGKVDNQIEKSNGRREFCDYRISISLLCLPAVIMVALTILQLLVLFPLVIVTFWGIVAYIHIFLIIVALAFITIGLVICQSVFLLGEKHEEAQGTRFYLQVVCICVPGALAFLSFFCINTFFLYYTGDWMTFHEAFFSEINWTLPSFPSFKMLTFPELTFDVLLEILTFQPVMPSLMLEVGVAVSWVASILKTLGAIFRFVRASWRLLFPKDEKADQEAQSSEAVPPHEDQVSEGVDQADQAAAGGLEEADPPKADQAVPGSSEEAHPPKAAQEAPESSEAVPPHEEAQSSEEAPPHEEQVSEGVDEADQAAAGSLGEADPPKADQEAPESSEAVPPHEDHVSEDADQADQAVAGSFEEAPSPKVDQASPGSSEAAPKNFLLATVPPKTPLRPLPPPRQPPSPEAQGVLVRSNDDACFALSSCQIWRSCAVERGPNSEA